jgi:1-acyl-sn-glycerol-3-phosphate acyltransferase
VVDSVRGRLDRERVDRRRSWWAARCIGHAGLRFEVHGAEAIDWSRAYVVMTNHQSYLDIPVITAAVRGSLRFIAKKELFRVPVFGPAMKAAGIISIDRQNRSRAIESLREAAEELREGVSIWIAPEGTRTRDGSLGRLKKGGFVLAMETGADILPAAISGTAEAMPRSGGLRRGVKASVTFGSPIAVPGRPREALMADVEAFLRAHGDEPGGPAHR